MSSTIEKENLEDHFISKQQFSKDVEKVVLMGKGDVSFIEASISVAEVYGIDLSEIKKFLTNEVQRKIEIEATENNLIQQSDLSEESISTFFE